MTTEYNPQPKYDGANFFRELGNISETCLLFSFSLSLCFLVQAIPKLWLLLAIAYIISISYLALTSKLRIALFKCGAITLALLVGFWDLAFLFPLHAILVATVLIGIVFLAYYFIRKHYAQKK